MLPVLVPGGCMPCPGAIYMVEIVKKCKISLPAQDQVSGERYRTVGPLVMYTGLQEITDISLFQASI